MTKDSLISGLIFLIGIFCYIPLTAIGVQESDGAEMAYQAMMSGVLHPPGFPLYSLISIYLVKLFPENPYHTLAVFSALCQALAGSIIFLTAKVFLKSSWVSVAIALSWMLFPATFRSATDCEVFALNNFLCALICFLASKILYAETKPLLFLGLITGLAWSNHQMSLFFTPLVLAACCKNLSFRLIASFIFGLLLGLSPHLYLVFQIYQPDPNLFFPLSNYQELFGYLTRSVYGTFSLKLGSESNDISYIWHFLKLISFYAPLTLISSFVLIIKFPKYKLLALGMLFSILANLWFASNLIFPNDVDVHGELLMRFYPGILLSLLIPLPLMIKELALRNSEYWGFFLLLIIPIFWQLPMKIEAADAKNDRVIEMEIKMILEELPPHAIFISNLDRQTMGIPYYQETLKLNRNVEVVIQSAIQNPEYKMIISKRIFNQSEPAFSDFSSFLKLALKNNRPVFILSGEVPEEFAILPYKHTWQITTPETVIEIPDLTKNLLTSCSQLPIEFLNISEHRHNSRVIIQTAFLTGWRWLAKHPLHFPQKKIAKAIIGLYEAQKYADVKNLCTELLK